MSIVFVMPELMVSVGSVVAWGTCLALLQLHCCDRSSVVSCENRPRVQDSMQWLDFSEAIRVLASKSPGIQAKLIPSSSNGNKVPETK